MKLTGDMGPDGPKFDSFTPDELRKKGVPDDVIAAAVEAETAKLQRAPIRKEIQERVGDGLSLLGTAADASALSLLGLAAMSEAIEASSDWDEFKAGFQANLNSLAKEGGLVQLLAGFSARLQDGQTCLPLHTKGIENTMAEIEPRSTAIAAALSNSN